MPNPFSLELFPGKCLAFPTGEDAKMGPIKAKGGKSDGY